MTNSACESANSTVEPSAVMAQGTNALKTETFKMEVVVLPRTCCGSHSCWCYDGSFQCSRKLGLRDALTWLPSVHVQGRPWVTF